MSRWLACWAVVAMLAGAVGCSGTDLDYEAEMAEAELFHEIEQAEVEQRAAESRAVTAAAAEQAKRDAANLAVAQRAARAAEAERLRRNLVEAAQEREKAEIQELFERGWARGCEQVAAAPRESGETVSYDECMSLVETTDVASREDAEGFGEFMAEYAVSELYGP